MERWNGKVAVVTGASSGIGEALVKKLLHSGIKVAALARRVDRLQKLEGECKANKSCKGSLKGLKCDVTKEEEVKSAFDWIEENWGAVHILVNNAAVLHQNLLTSIDVSQVSQTMNINVVGTLIVLKYGMQSMQKHNIEHGHVFFVNSIAGHEIVPMPGMSAYCASKHALKVFSSSLINEFSFMKKKIRITSIHPGLVETEMSSQFKEHIKDDTPILKACDIADAIIFALSAPPHVNISELTIQPVGESMAATTASLMHSMNEQSKV
ncbi:hypothetical protein O3M35_007103 [Rhynocoris fuscipes]|uniref:Dehydrogenase/reductase SDR family member 11 n=1 Tax=Rhynocoris fuscipes TaxID=488301 RepID=A0AAW1DFK9_9HEMI